MQKQQMWQSVCLMSASVCSRLLPLAPACSRLLPLAPACFPLASRLLPLAPACFPLAPACFPLAPACSRLLPLGSRLQAGTNVWLVEAGNAKWHESTSNHKYRMKSCEIMWNQTKSCGIMWKQAKSLEINEFKRFQTISCNFWRFLLSSNNC